MKTTLNPYLSFRDNAREVMEFYHSVFGGQLTAETFKDYHMSHGGDDENLIMHSAIVTDDFTLMAADTPKEMGEPRPNGAISLSGDDHEALSGYFAKFADGGTVVAPLEQAPWGDTFGMVTDKYGVFWMINILAKKDA